MTGNKETSEVMTNDILANIKEWTVEDSVEQFKQHRERIFRFGMQDVSDTLNSLDFAVVNTIRQSLVEESISTFPQLKDHRVPQRIVVHTAARDVYNLGYSVVNGSLTREAEKIFIKDCNPGAPQATDNGPALQMQELLESVLVLTARVSALEKDVTTLKEDNSYLKSQLEGRDSVVQAILNNDNAEHVSSSDTEGDDFQVPREHKRKKMKKNKKTKGASDTSVKTTDNPNVSVPGPQSTSSTVAQQSTQAGRTSASSSLQASKSYSEVSRNTTQGNETTGGLRAAENLRNNTPTSDIFITGAEINTPIRHVNDVLVGIGISNAKILDVTRKDGSALWKSFKATIPEALKDRALQQNEWPKGISVRPFYPRSDNRPFRGGAARGGPPRTNNWNDRFHNNTSSRWDSHGGWNDHHRDQRNQFNGNWRRTRW